MRINDYIENIVRSKLNLQKNQAVEIVTSSYVNEFNEMIRHTCLALGASMVFFRYRDGKELESKINDGYSRYIEEDISNYNIYINKKSLVRIVIDSPYTPPIVASNDKLLEYKNEQKKLKFVNDYFNELYSQRVMVVCANPYWAAKLCMSEMDLWNIIYEMSLYNNCGQILNKLNQMSPNMLHFVGDGTDLCVELTADYVFQGDTQITSNNICFNPNYPCHEIFTAPSKHKVNGYISIARPSKLGSIEFSGRIDFKDGKITTKKYLDKLIEIDENLIYCGEIALCEALKYPNTGSLLLDENMGCHIALGCAYSYGIKELDKINISSKHIDLVFGNDKLDVYASVNDKIVKIMDSGKFII